MLGGRQHESEFREKQFPHIHYPSALKLQGNGLPFQVFDISLSLRINVMASDMTCFAG